jgi:NitT/TauT family transport system permease protein
MKISDALSTEQSKQPDAEQLQLRVVLRKVYESSWFAMSVTLIGILLVWYLATEISKVPAYLLPKPVAVAIAFTSNWHMLLQETWATFREVIGGFAISIAVAIPLALLVVYSQAAERFINPLLIVSQAVPKIAIAPLFLVWFGFGEFPKMLIAALIAFFPMLISATVGLKSIDPEMLNLARAMGASATKTFWKVRLPIALPNFFAGFKLAITFSVIGAVVGEFVGGDHGVGYLIQLASGSQRTDLLFAGLILLSAMGLALFYVVEAFERKFVFWHHSQINATM